MSWDAVWARWEGKRSYMVEERGVLFTDEGEGPKLRQGKK